MVFQQTFHTITEFPNAYIGLQDALDESDTELRLVAIETQVQIDIEQSRRAATVSKIASALEQLILAPRMGSLHNRKLPNDTQRTTT